nr:hypothetical protein [Chroomonas debatzensis]
MIFNLFSTYRQILKPIDIVQNTNKTVFTSFNSLQVGNETFDPVIKLLTELKTRKNNKVIVSTDSEIIQSLFNDNRKDPSIFVTVNKAENPVTINKPTRLPAIFRSQRAPNFPTAQNKTLLNKLKKIPVYVVVNNNKELITANPRVAEELSVGEWISSKYYNWFVWKEDEGPVSLGLFFMDKRDCETYLHEICKKDPQGAERVGVRVDIVGLDKFYEMNRTSCPGFQVKLIANLKEMNSLILKYKKDAFYSLNPKQQHSKNNFQGTPIYIIRNSVGKSKVQKKPVIIQYKIKNNNAKTNVFFKLEDVYSAWEKLKDYNPDIEFPSNPQVEIYNLENYLLDCEKEKFESLENINFVPTQESYKIIADYSVNSVKEQPPLSKKLSSTLNEKIKTFKNIYKGVIWLFTSDTLPTEDNGW